MKAQDKQRGMTLTYDQWSRKEKECCVMLFGNWFGGKVSDELMERVDGHREVMPEVLDFVDACKVAVNDDGKISRTDAQTLMKHYWKVIKAVQKS